MEPEEGLPNCPAAERLPSWKRLARLAADPSLPTIAELLEDSPRVRNLQIEAGGLLFDFSKQRASPAVLAELLELAEERQWRARTADLFHGAAVNSTQGRAALHTALRAPPERQPPVAGGEVIATLDRLKRFAAEVANGRRAGCSGKAFTQILHIGIGGSELGPRLALEALQSPNSQLRVRFVANLDGHALARALDGLDPETALFIVASKSFATLETRLNAESASRWLLERTGRPEALARHFIAVTANSEAARDFGLPPESIFPIQDWVGGRFSLWSSVGLPVILALGDDAFDSLLAGAHAMDRHFQNAPAASNAPLLAALLGIWNSNFLGATSQAVLPYDERLRLLPDYLRQLETESNGKRVRRDGSALGIHSAPMLWGGVGTTGQHAFHQWLHQGTHDCAVDFILTAKASHGLPDHHRWLLANGLSQAKALALGAKHPDPQRTIPGNRPSTTIVLDRLNPFQLGALLAFYEHKVFCQGLIWDINSFDQWGVDLGKRLAKTLFKQLGGAAAECQDASTRFLIERLGERGPETEARE